MMKRIRIIITKKHDRRSGRNILRKHLAGVGMTLFGLCLVSTHAVSPKKWELQRWEQFLKGKFEGVSISYEGILSLAPREEGLPGPSEEFYLSMLRGNDENLYLGTGHGGNIYRIGQDGKAELHFHAPEMDVYCLVQDSRGHLYAGTSPNGKIYKITAPMKGEPFFDPQERYIWDLEFMDDGTLLAAVGESGGIYVISPQGEGRELLEANENHILCMQKTPDGEILAGSGGKGRLYRLAKDRTPAILFESPYEEIRTLALDGQGNIYAAAGGKLERPAAKSPSTASPTGAAVVTTDVAITVTPSGAIASELETGEKAQPGALFRIGGDGVAKRIWESNEDLIYTLLWDDRDQRILFGTGKRGRIFAADQSEKVSLLLQKDSEQVFALLAGDSRIYALANNPANLSLIYPEQRSRGEYTSEVFDAGLLSSWGRVDWDAALPKGTMIQLQTRSGNSDRPSETWSNWSPPYQNSPGEQILNPNARYIQLKILFKTDSGRTSPEVYKVSLFYLQTNVAPKISSFSLLPVNTVFLQPPIQDEKIMGLNPGPAALSSSQDASSILMMSKKVERKGYQTVVWEADDANGDPLLYELSIKERAAERWRRLKSGLAEKIFAFETITLPDGEYILKLEAHDTPSNPLGRELKTDKTSRPFVIDNSLPAIRGFQADRQGARLSLEFAAQDDVSRIKEVMYLIRPDEWRPVFPQDGMCDSKVERFQFAVTLSQQSDDMVIVKVVDEHGNVGVHRAVF